MFIPDWWKSTPKSKYSDDQSLSPEYTIKTCTAFKELYSNGIIQPLWSDLNLKVYPDGKYEYQFADSVSTITDHQEWQHEGSPYSNGQHTQVKLISPWVAKSKNNIKWLFTSPYWSGQGVGDMHVSHGIMPFNVIPSAMHVNMFFRRREAPFVYRLEFGTPLAHIIPLTDKEVKINYHLVSEQELDNMQRHSTINFFFLNRFTKAKKRCPYA